MDPALAGFLLVAVFTALIMSGRLAPERSADRESGPGYRDLTPLPPRPHRTNSSAIPRASTSAS